MLPKKKKKKLPNGFMGGKRKRDVKRGGPDWAQYGGKVPP